MRPEKASVLAGRGPSVFPARQRQEALTPRLFHQAADRSRHWTLCALPTAQAS